MPHGDRSRSPTDNTALNSGAAAATPTVSIMGQDDVLQFPRPGATPQGPFLSPESQFEAIWKKDAPKLVDSVKKSITGPIEDICKNITKSCVVGAERRIDDVEAKVDKVSSNVEGMQ